MCNQEKEIIEKVKKLKDRDTARQLVKEKDDYECSVCGERIKKTSEYHFCPKCGQRYS